MNPRNNLLVVDDERHTADTFARILRLEGFQVHTAGSAEGGLREADTNCPDAIILDLRMPLMDGLGFLRRLRSTVPHRYVPVAIVTGDYFVDDDVSAEIRQLGAELKFKPLWLEDLVALAHSLVKPEPVPPPSPTPPPSRRHAA